jgi:SHS2 domain-containing protein
MSITQRTAGQHEGAGCGHHAVPHAVGLLRIEAWGPTREDCIAEAVRGLVDNFAVVTGQAPHGRAERHVAARSDEGLLAAVLDEVVYWLDAAGEVPVWVAVRPALDGGVTVFLVLAGAEVTGGPPKPASLRDLRCAADQAGRWSCEVTVGRQPDPP